MVSKTGYAPDMTSKLRRAARAMMAGWFDRPFEAPPHAERRSRTVTLPKCLDLVKYATEEEQDALIAAREIDDMLSVGAIIDIIVDREFR